MEPKLITQRALKKILKKNYFKKESYLNKALNGAVDIVKVNYLAIIIVIFAILLLVLFYFEQQNKKTKQAEQFELEKEMIKINKPKESLNEQFRQKANYESEYYKMLPRVTNNPDVIPYQY